jgi:hypothetical protein
LADRLILWLAGLNSRYFGVKNRGGPGPPADEKINRPPEFCGRGRAANSCSAALLLSARASTELGIGFFATGPFLSAR